MSLKGWLRNATLLFYELTRGRQDRLRPYTVIVRSALKTGGVACWSLVDNIALYVNQSCFHLRRSWRGSTSSDAAVVRRSSFRLRRLLTTHRSPATRRLRHVTRRFVQIVCGRTVVWVSYIYEIWTAFTSLSFLHFYIACKCMFYCTTADELIMATLFLQRKVLSHKCSYHVQTSVSSEGNVADKPFSLLVVYFILYRSS